MNLSRRTLLASALAPVATSTPAQNKFYRFTRLKYIAALGAGAEHWGLWREDPGPIGVWLRFYKRLAKAGNIAPSGWRFDINDWRLDENGLLNMGVSPVLVEQNMTNSTYESNCPHPLNAPIGF